MLFPTAEYVLFFLPVLLIAWLSRRWLAGHKAFLLLASYFFYGYWDWRFLPLLIGISFIAWISTRALQATDDIRRKKVRLAIGVTASLSILAFFKYLGFATGIAVDTLAAIGIHWSPILPEIALPVGVSFFVFHGISLMMDGYRSKLQEKAPLLDSLLYIAFFPQLVAGPILRAASFLPQLRTKRDASSIDVSQGMVLIVIGLVKKVLIANHLATAIVDQVFETPVARSGLEVLLGIYGYAAQIYCDFSGYTDIAIGCALLLGYQFPKNFDSPYVAASPQEFWHRWHISLSSWLRDYLYIPLGGSRKGPIRLQVNLMLTMLLGGLWHGAAWNFVFWGALHGGALVVHRQWSESGNGIVQRVRNWRGWPMMARIICFHFVCFGWVFFRAPTWGHSWEVLKALGNPWTVGPWLTGGILLAILLGVLGQALPAKVRQFVQDGCSRWPLVVQGLALAVAVLLIDAMGPSGIAPFIYFQF